MRFCKALSHFWLWGLQAARYELIRHQGENRWERKQARKSLSAARRVKGKYSLRQRDQEKPHVEEWQVNKSKMWRERILIVSKRETFSALSMPLIGLVLISVKAFLFSYYPKAKEQAQQQRRYDNIKPQACRFITQRANRCSLERMQTEHVADRKEAIFLLHFYFSQLFSFSGFGFLKKKNKKQKTKRFNSF